MKFLLDVCVSSRALTDSLAARGHDVVSSLSIDSCASDEQLLSLALRDDRVLITQDKDFGELVFVHCLAHGPILRVVELSVEDQVRAVGELLDRYPQELTGSVVITVTRSRIRVRRQND